MPFSSVLGASSVIKPGVCTSTTRPSVPFEGQLIYETDTDRVAAYNGSAWDYTHSSGLVLISSTTIGSAVSSVTVSNAFSATYDNYKIIISGGTCSGSETDLQLTLGSQVSGYKSQQAVYQYNTSNPIFLAPTTQVPIGRADVDGLTADATLISPNLAKHTFIHSACGSDTFATTVFATSNSNTQFTAFTVTIGISGGTMTGGTIKVYGYKN